MGTYGGDAAAGARLATQGIADELVLPVTTRPYAVGGSPGMLLLGMPGQRPTVQIVVAHQGTLYLIVAFGNATLRAD